MKSSKFQNDSFVSDFKDLVPVIGFSGYLIDRFNDIVSFRAYGGKVVATYMSKMGKYRLECVTLYDDKGKRRFRSKRKVLVSSLGKSEYERREALRKKRIEIELKEKRELDAYMKHQHEEHQKIIDEMHKDDKPYTGSLLALDPQIRERVIKARQRRREEALGDLF